MNRPGSDADGKRKHTLSFCHHLFQWDGDLQKNVLEALCSESSIQRRDTNMTLLSKHMNIAIKLIPHKWIVNFIAESSFANEVERHRSSLKIVMPFHGALMVNAVELVELVRHRNPSMAANIQAFLSEFPSSYTTKEAPDEFNPHLGPYMGIIVTTYLHDSFSLTDWIIQRRVYREEPYRHELHYILAMCLAFQSTLQVVIPGAKLHDFTPDNILLTWTSASENIPVSSWGREILPSPPKELLERPDYEIKKPPGMRIAIIDYGLAWMPKGISQHIVDINLGIHGICPFVNPNYDTHTLLNAYRDMLLSRSDVGLPNLLRTERLLLGKITELYKPHLLGFGMAVGTNQAASGRGGPLVVDHGLGPQPLVQGRLSGLPTFLQVNRGEQESQIQATAVVAIQKLNPTIFKTIVNFKCPAGFVDDLFSNEHESTMRACGYMNLHLDPFPSIWDIFSQNKLGLCEFKKCV